MIASVAWPLATVVAKRSQRLHRVWDRTLGGVLLLLGFPSHRSGQMSDKDEQAKRKLYEISKGLLIWAAAAVIGIGFLYLLSVWVNHDPLRP